MSLYCQVFPYHQNHYYTRDECVVCDIGLRLRLVDRINFPAGLFEKGVFCQWKNLPFFWKRLWSSPQTLSFHKNSLNKAGWPPFKQIFVYRSLEDSIGKRFFIRCAKFTAEWNGSELIKRIDFFVIFQKFYFKIKPIKAHKNIVEEKTLKAMNTHAIRDQTEHLCMFCTLS